MNKLKKSDYEINNREIINNNFPERIDLLIPCTCGKTFKAQDGHFIITKDKTISNLLGIKKYKGFSWKCRNYDKVKRRIYSKNNPYKKTTFTKKNEKHSLNATICGALKTHHERFNEEQCIFKKGNSFIYSEISKEAREHNKKVIIKLLEQQNYKCALTGDPINELTMSIDRINSNKGYTEDNIQLVTVQANFAKQKLLNNEFIDLCTKVYLHTQSKKSSQNLYEKTINKISL